MDLSYIARNDASRKRLQSVLGALKPNHFGLIVHEGWTVAATLAHLAFSDRQIQGWLEEWGREGIRTSAALQEWDKAARIRLRGQNDELLSRWLATDPQEIKAEVIAAAETIDDTIANLSPALTETILTTSLFGRRRPWVIDRSIHRDEHLDEIERARSSVAAP